MNRGCDKLRNKPRNNFKRINIDEEIIKLQQRMEEIANLKEQGLPPT